jgi:excisionase family DNA binding protein
MNRNDESREIAMPKRQLISTTRAAALLNVSPNTVRAMIADEKFVGYMVGRLVKVDQNEIEAYLDRAATN